MKRKDKIKIKLHNEQYGMILDLTGIIKMKVKKDDIFEHPRVTVMLLDQLTQRITVEMEVAINKDTE